MLTVGNWEASSILFIFEKSLRCDRPVLSGEYSAVFLSLH